MRLRLALGKIPNVDQEIGVVFLIKHWHHLLHPTNSVPMLLATTLTCAAITFVLGVASELRVWLPCWTILAMLVVIGSHLQSDREWLLGLLDRKS